MSGLGEALAFASVGAVINNRIPIDDSKSINNKSKKGKTNTRNIYSTNNSRAVRDDHESKARDRFRQSLDFKNTKMIPKDYSAYDEFKSRNQNKLVDIKEGFSNSDNDSTFTDDDCMSQNQSQSFDDNMSSCSISNNPTSMLDKINNISNNRKFESSIANPNKNDLSNRNKFNEKNNWVSQFEQMKFDNSNDAVPINSSNKNTNNIARIELERQMELDGGYSLFEHNDDGTYGVVKSDSPEFVHENMAPFVRKGPSDIEESKKAMVNQMKMELFTGSSDDPSWRPKIERAPLFSPLVGAVNIYGDPVRTDEYKSRYFAGKEKRNELPFQQVKVTPGLDIGYNAVGKHGYHDMYRVIPTEAYTDNLRTLNNPKVSYGSYVGPGQKGVNGPVLGKVTQYKTPKYRERGTKDMVRGRSYHTAPTVYGEYDPKNLATINRGTKETIKFGPAQYNIDGNTPGKYRGNYQEAKRENYKYDHPRNLAHFEAFNGQGHNNNSFIPDPTQREMKSQHGHAYNYDGTTTYTYSQDGTTPDPTKRDQNNQYDRSGHLIGNRSQITAINWNDVADPTKRDQNNQYDRSGHLTGNKNQVIAVNWNDVSDPTRRDIHNQYDRSGNVTGEKNQVIAVNWDDISDPTKRDQHNQFDRSGHVTGNKNQVIVVNWDDIADPTKRDQHNKFDRSGHLIGNKNQIIAVNWDDVSDPTKRDQHNKFDRSGHLIGNKNQIIAVNWDDVSDPTKRDQHNQYDRSGYVTGEKNQVIAVNWDDVADPTKRDQHNQYDRSGHITGNKNQVVAVNWDDVSDPTKRDQHNQYDRSGNVTGNKNQVIAVNWDDVADPTRRDQHNKYDRSGHITGNRNQVIAVNWDDVPDVTRREINPGGRSGNVTGDKQEYKAINWDDVPDVTRREMNPGGRSSNVTGNRQQYNAINWDDVPDVTKREIHPGGRHGPADSQDRRQGSRHQYMGMLMNGAKEALNDGRAPTKVGMDKGWTINHTAFMMREPIEWKWRPGPATDILIKNDQLGIVNTKVPNNRFWVNDRILAHTEENLKGNPLVNNLIHKSI